MASTFSSWETDPFFAAAEDVQQSADRMESAYRNWIFKRALAEETTAGQRTVNICNDDVATALDTTKWQLEEFAKAVTVSDTFLLGEEVSRRHFSFIEAIQNQIFLIDNALHKGIDVQFPNSAHSVKFNGEERDQLEMFLSGGTSSPATDQLAHDVNQHNSSLTSSRTMPISNVKRPMVTGLMRANHDSQGFGASSSSNECFVDVCKPQYQNNSLEIIEAGKEEILEAQILQDSKVSSGHTNFVPMVQSAHSDIVKVNRVKKPPSHRNGLRRWKSGSLCIAVKEDATLCRKGKPQPDVELGYFPEDSRSRRQNYLQSAGWSRLQRVLLSRCTAAVCKSSGQRTTFLFVYLCLGCVYFWFLSSLVPYMNTLFPHSF